jgi:hypothetical protein
VVSEVVEVEFEDSGQVETFDAVCEVIKFHTARLLIR